MPKFRTILLLASLIMAVGSAAASPRCKIAMEAWQPRQALEDKLKAEGWQIRRIKTDDGCYKVEGLRPDGQRVKATFQPDTLMLIRESLRND